MNASASSEEVPDAFGPTPKPGARILVARAIPFVFVTGYTRESIDGRYADVPVIGKPIEPAMLRKVFLDGRFAGAPADIVPPIAAAG